MTRHKGGKGPERRAFSPFLSGIQARSLLAAGWIHQPGGSIERWCPKFLLGFHDVERGDGILGCDRTHSPNLLLSMEDSSGQVTVAPNATL